MNKILKQIIGVLVFVVMSVSMADAGVLLTYPKFRATNDSGTALVSGKLYTYIAGTTTNKATYSDYNLATANANPVVLDRRGEATVYGAGAFKFVLKDSAGNTIWTMDNLELSDAGSYQIFPDSTVTNQDDPAEAGSILNLLTALGTSKRAEIVLTHTGASNTTTYAVGTSADWSAYTNVTFKIVQGARLQIATATTTTITGPIEAGLYQIFSIVGTGSVSFSSGATTSETITYPEWFGAIGDGNLVTGTDDTTAVQRAITAGAKIALTRYYRITSQLTGVNTKELYGSIPQASLYFYGCDGITAGNDAHIHNIQMYLKTAAGVVRPMDKNAIESTSSTYLNIHDNYFDGWDYVVYLSTVTDSVIHKNKVSFCNSGVYAETVSNNNIITNNYFQLANGVGTRYGINLAYVTTQDEGTVITGNVIYGATYGIYLDYTIGAYIANNDISQSVTAGIHFEVGRNISVIGNWIQSLPGAAVYAIDSTALGAAISCKNKIIGNSIEGGASGYGIRINTYNSNWVVEGNTIESNTYALYLNGQVDNVNFSHNNIISNGTGLPEIRISGTRHTIADNTGGYVTNSAVETMIYNNTHNQKFTFGSAVPTTGTWNVGDIVYSTAPAATGTVRGWICTTAGTFSAASEAGTSAIGSPVLTAMADNSDFYLGQYVNVSAGFPSASASYMILGKVANTSITIDTNATGAGVQTVTTPNPVFTAFGQVGYRSGAADPTNAVVPLFIGEEYLFTTGNHWYKSHGATNADWTALN